ncbi:MAG: hypothetical protein EOP48_30805, partial [Sphingobacteriales bacterium]
MDWNYREESNKEALAIVRVSSHKQTEGASPDVQENEIYRYCAERGLVLVRVARLQESAKDSDKRQEYDKEIRHALKKNIRHVLFYMSDREARNMTDIEASNKLILLGKIIVHHVQERKVYWKNSSTSDFLMRNIN